MANWTKLSDGTWGIQTRTGTTGQTVTVTRADGTASPVTLGALVKRTRWGTVFAVAGRKAPTTRTTRRRRRRFNPGAPHPQAILISLGGTLVVAPVVAPVVATPEPVDASVARFLLLDLGDDAAPAVDTPDDGPGRQLQID